MENRSCHANLMAFIDEITSLDDDGNCVGLKSLDFCELILMTIRLRKLE